MKIIIGDQDHIRAHNNVQYVGLNAYYPHLQYRRPKVKRYRCMQARLGNNEKVKV